MLCLSLMRIQIIWTFEEFKYTHTPKHDIMGKTFQNITSQPIQSMSYLGRTCIHDIPNLWGTHVIRALQIHDISWNLLNVIIRSHMHTWHFEPLGNSCYTCTPNTCHLMECKCKLVEYHYTYVLRPIPENICILIHLAWNHFPNHATHHHAMHALVLFSCFFACKASILGLVYVARSINFLVLHLFWSQEHQLSSLTVSNTKNINSLVLLFLMLGASTFWSYTCSACKASTPGLVQRSWFCYASASTLSVLCAHAITYANHPISCFFINHHQNMYHITFLNPHVLKHNLRAHTSSKHHFNIIKTIHMHISFKNTIGSRLSNHIIYFA